MKQRILVVDDSYYMRTILKNMLVDAGFNVVDEAASGEAAEKMVSDHNPDLVTLDLILPDNTGLEVLKNIKNLYPHTKVVIVSAVGQESVVKEAMDLGASAYIVKPFEENKVVEIINNCFN